MLLVGGTDVESAMRECTDNGSHIVICTPGRILDMLDRRVEMSSEQSGSSSGAPAPGTSSRGMAPVLDTSQLKVLVMDEADMLLELGFERAMGRLLERLPKTRVTALFSATQTKEVRALAMAGMLDPVLVRVRVRAPVAGSDPIGAGSKDKGEAAAARSEGAHAVQDSALPQAAPASSGSLAVPGAASGLALRLPSKLTCFSIRCPASMKMGALIALLRDCYRASTPEPCAASGDSVPALPSPGEGASAGGDGTQREGSLDAAGPGPALPVAAKSSSQSAAAAQTGTKGR